MEEINNHIETNESNKSPPIWCLGNGIDEIYFCECFLAEHPLIYINHQFFNLDGQVVSDDRLRKLIYQEIFAFVTTNAAKRVESILRAMRIHAYSDPLPVEEDCIHFANGKLYLDGSFRPSIEFCVNRLPLRYNPGAPPPQRWLTFLEELLYPEDIPTLQEFLGYCLIPSTRGQKMLLLIGAGGEGKSRIPLVMRALLGNAMNTGSLVKVETNRFASADLEGKLLMVDDDIKLEALPQTNNLKTIITAELPLDLERKGVQSYQGKLYTRFLALGNGTLRALYDHSDGFFRRQIILNTRPKPPNRLDDPYLGDRLRLEVDGILLWALEGLQRLRRNNFQFTISDRAKENLKQAMADSNNVLGFLESEGYITLDPNGSSATRCLYDCYLQWCEDNAFRPQSPQNFRVNLGVLAHKYGLHESNNIYLPNSRRARGFKGIRTLAPPTPAA